ncbi:hypothetical protein V8G54_036010 [Vigna mungo]|uniref:Uncharacterized protein n=1 Tax=Vigna mungo TaxID=3915 RepID=A0AAQ3MFY8_VIGMU
MHHSGLLNPENIRATMVCVETNGERRFDGVANAEEVEEQQQRLISGDEKVLEIEGELHLHRSLSPSKPRSFTETSSSQPPARVPLNPQIHWFHIKLVTQPSLRMVKTMLMIKDSTTTEFDEEEDEETHRVDERDISLHGDFLREVKELVGEAVAVARVFVKGRYVDVTPSLLQCL